VFSKTLLHLSASCEEIHIEILEFIFAFFPLSLLASIQNAITFNSPLSPLSTLFEYLSAVFNYAHWILHALLHAQEEKRNKINFTCLFHSRTIDSGRFLLATRAADEAYEIYKEREKLLERGSN
jgi:hypothetical protein